MLSDNELQELKIHLIAFIDSIDKEEFIDFGTEHGFDEICRDGRIEMIPNGMMTLTLKILRPNRPETDPKLSDHCV